MGNTNRLEDIELKSAKSDTSFMNFLLNLNSNENEANHHGLSVSNKQMALVNKLFQQLSSESFEVELDSTNGLGLKLGMTRAGFVIITGFKNLANGAEGPAALCDKLKIQDVLLAIDGQYVKDLSFTQVSSAIKACCNNYIRLTFGRIKKKLIIQNQND